MKKILLVFISLVMLVGAALPAAPASAAEAVVNATDVTLYALEDCYNGIISIPSSYPQSFQLRVSGSKVYGYYINKGDSVVVDDNGLIKPNKKVTYWYGNIGVGAPYDGVEPTDITVKQKFGESLIVISVEAFVNPKVNVNVVDYADIYADALADNYVKKNIKSSMSDYEKIETILKYVSNFTYSTKYQSFQKMMILGEGDCWAFANTVVHIANKAGLDAWVRDARKDGMGSGHRDVMIKTSDGDYYEVDASYGNGNYTIKKRESLFSYRTVSDGIEVYQYDGKEFPATLTVPGTIDGKTVVSIASQSFGAKNAITKVSLPASVKRIGTYTFAKCEKIASLNLPKSLETIGTGAFYGCQNISLINASPNFKVENGIVYNADKTTLVCAPAVKNLNVPSGVTKIGTYACYNNSALESVTLPASVTEIGSCAFADCKKLSSFIINGSGLKKINEAALARCYALLMINVPSSVNSVGSDIFYEDNKLEVRTESESVITHCKNNNITVNSHNPAEAVKENVVPSTCVKKGTYDSVVYCKSCGKELSRTPTYLPYSDEHVPVKDEAVPSTCIKQGLTEGSHCALCGKILVAQKPTELDDHVWDNGVDLPGSTFWRGTTLYTCKVCRETFTEDYVVVDEDEDFDEEKPIKYPARPKLLSLKRKKRSFTANWSSAKRAEGYQVRYSTKKNMKKAKTITVKGKQKLSYTVKKLKKNKKYYVRVRAYRVVNGKRYYSKWSKTKSVKTK